MFGKSNDDKDKKKEGEQSSGAGFGTLFGGKSSNTGALFGQGAGPGTLFGGNTPSSLFPNLGQPASGQSQAGTNPPPQSITSFFKKPEPKMPVATQSQNISSISANSKPEQLAQQKKQEGQSKFKPMDLPQMSFMGMSKSKKDETPQQSHPNQPSSGLFSNQSGSLFGKGSSKDQSVSSLFQQAQKAQKPQLPQSKPEAKVDNNTSSGLFGIGGISGKGGLSGMSGPSMFGTKKESPKEEKRENPALLAGTTSNPSMFSRTKSEEIVEASPTPEQKNKNTIPIATLTQTKVIKDKEIKMPDFGAKKEPSLPLPSAQKGSLFTGFGAGFAGANNASSFMSKKEEDQQKKIQPVKVNMPNQPKPKQQYKNLDFNSSVNFSFAKSSQDVKAPTQKKQEPKLLKEPSTPTLGGSLFGKLPVPPQTQPAPPTIQNIKPSQGQTNKQTGLPEFPASNIDNKKRVFDYPIEVPSQKDQKGETVTTRVDNSKKTSEKPSQQQESSRITPSVNFSNQNLEGAKSVTQPPKETASYLSTIKPRLIASKDFIDFKTLREEESTHTFQTYLTQKRGDILQTIKIYFSVRSNEHKNVELPAGSSEKQRFFKDFTNLLVNYLQIESNHFPAAEAFVRKIMKEEQYEAKMFVDDKFAPAYFNQNSIYWQDYKGQYTLNDRSSPQLTHLAQKFIQRWYSDKTSFINFILKHQELISPKEDLFSYLLKALLQQSISNDRETPNATLSNIIRDYNRVLSTKLMELLSYCNAKLGKNYRLLTEQPEKFIISTFSLIEAVGNQKIISCYLKIVLNALRLNQPAEKISSQLARCVRQTKSMALLPLRVIFAKLKQGKLDFAPSPNDLYKYIRGDEWLEWLDTYLGCNKTNTIQLLVDEPPFLVDAICSISGERLIDRLVGSKKGIYKFFQLLKEQNMADYYYRMLEACLHNEQSIKQIQEFYFKKVFFNFEYQQTIEYITHFHQNLSKPIQQITNQAYIFKTMPSKISLLTKILQIDPQRLFDLERYIFTGNYNQMKKFRPSQGIQNHFREGHKLVHIFIDIIRIVSIKNLSINILPKIFRVLTMLLKNKRTQPIVIAATNISQPYFHFLSQQNLPSSVWHSLTELFEHILNSNYIYDLVICDNSSSKNYNQQLQQLYYSLRYNNTEFQKLTACEPTNLSQTFSLKWIQQLFGAIGRRKFDSQIIQKLLSKLIIQPHEQDHQEYDIGYRKHHKLQGCVPKVFQMVVNLVNTYTVWEEIMTILEFKVHREGGQLILVNKYSHSLDSQQSFKTIFSTLKLLRTIFQLHSTLQHYQVRCPNHFIVKTLSSVNVLSRVSINTVIDQRHHTLLLALIANLQTEQAPFNDSQKGIVLESELPIEDEGRKRAVLGFLRQNQNWIDFQMAGNFIKTSTDRYCSNQDNITTLSLQNITYYLKMCPGCSLQFSLQSLSQLDTKQNLQLKSDMLRQLIKVITFYLNHKDYRSISYKILKFMCDLKYDLGQNILNKSIAETLMFEYLRRQGQDARWQSKDICQIVRFLAEETQNVSTVIKDKAIPNKFQKVMDIAIYSFLYNFDLRKSYIAGRQPIRNTSEIGNMLLNYSQTSYSSCNYNQIERLIEQKAITDIGQTWIILSHTIDILMHKLTQRQYSDQFAKSLQMFNKIIAQKNLLLMQIDMQFDPATSKSHHQFLSNRIDQPRQFIRDSLELFLSQGKSIAKKEEIQVYQKNNLIQWFLYISQTLSEKLNSYMLMVLSIDHSFYANNPVQFTVSRSDKAHRQLFSHLALGSSPLGAIDIFARVESEAAAVVQLIAQNSLNRINQLHSRMTVFKDSSHRQQQQYTQGINVLSSCLEWLRHKKTGNGQSASRQMVHYISQKYQSLLPVHNKPLTKQQLKALLSYLTQGEIVPNNIKYDIHHYTYHILEQYCLSMKTHHPTDAMPDLQELAQLAQQAFSLLLVCPPASNQPHVLQTILDIWTQENTNQFFYHQSRLILELCSIYPDQMAKFKPLTKCKIVEESPNTLLPESRYVNNQRQAENVSWIWALKIASTLANHSTSVLAVQEASTFLIKHKTKIFKILQGSQTKLTRSYLQQLQGVLELIISLLSTNLWVSNNLSLMQELTYILSHHLIKLFVSTAQGRTQLVPMSRNQKVFCQIKVSTMQDDQQLTDQYNSDHFDNLFNFEMRLRVTSCLRCYCLAMETAFKTSQYDQKYFNSTVYGSNRYLSSFWDNFNKNVVVLFNYSLARVEYWLKVKKAKNILKNLNECLNAPDSFKSNGFLTTLSALPNSEDELLNDHYLLSYLLTQLATVHYLKQKSYNHKLTHLLGSHPDVFSRRIKEHINRCQQLSKRFSLTTACEISDYHFQQLSSTLKN